MGPLLDKNKSGFSFVEKIEGGEASKRTFEKMLRITVLIPLVVVLSLGGIYVWEILYLMDLNRAVSHTDEVLTQANLVQRLIVDAETGTRGFLLNREEVFLQPYILSNAELPGAFINLKQMTATNQVQKRAADKLEADYSAWKKTAEARIAATRAGGKVTVGENLQGKALMDVIRGTTAEIIQYSERLRVSSGERLEGATNVVLTITVLGGVFVALLLAFLGRSQLFTLSTTYSESLKRQLEQNSVLERQAWLRTGLSEILASIRGDIDPEEAARRILQLLHTYLAADILSFYGRDPREQHFHLLASLGAQGEKIDVPGKITRGEGVLGKAATLQKAVLLEDLPEGYLKVSSSLGSAGLSKVFVAPFYARGETIALVEIAFLNEPKESDRVLELLDQMGESLGTYFQASYLRVRQKQLLEETQQLNEELQTQQEELRVSNEELEQQAAILSASQERLEGHQTNLEESNQKLEAQAALLDQRAQALAAASRYKSEFLANMSHELRTPLNSSLILARLLADNAQKNLTAEQVEFAETIYAAGNDLLSLINDILDLAKVEAGKLELHRETISTGSLLSGIRKIFAPMAQAKGLTFQVEAAEGLPAQFESDRRRLEQVLKNLLSNALKFTERGEVDLLVESAGDRLRFIVSDTGIGIDPKQHDVIFEAFRQADGTTNRKFGGTGLGLSISRELAQMLGGTITLISRPGQGSRFQLEIPAKMPNVESAPTTMDPALLGMRKSPKTEAKPAKDVAEIFEGLKQVSPPAGKRSVLLIEDDPSFSRSLEQLAVEHGFHSLVAKNAADGLVLAKKHLPSAIILDIGLPDQTGISVLDTLKQDLNTRHIPVHIISGFDYSHAAMERGAVGYMLKPVKQEQLKKAFQTLEQKLSQQIKQVLIVEDDSTQAKSIKALIGGPKVETERAERGEKAILLMQEKKFDCVILDLSLPDMTGFEVLERLSQIEDFVFPPIIVYTGRDLTRDEEDKLRRYSNSIIVKGARSPERLLDEVSLFLHQVESELPPERRKMLESLKSRDQQLEGKSILLVDDDARNLFALMHALEPKGAKLTVARNGKEALEVLKKSPRFDVILMDIMMPEMDGYEAIREIRANPEMARIPIIAVTAKAMASDYENCLKAGANDYLAKPIDTQRLFSLLKVWIQRGVMK